MDARRSAIVVCVMVGMASASGVPERGDADDRAEL